MNMNPASMMLVVTIVDRAKSIQASHFFRRKNVKLLLSCWGQGTASSEIMDILGITEKAKDVILGIVPKSWLPVLITQLSDEMQLRNPGKGILFTITLSAANKGIPNRYEASEIGEDSEVRVMYEVSDKKYELIIVSTEDGFVEVVMDAARSAGARGGTVLRARAADDENTESFFGLKLHDEMEIVAIVVERDEKLKIMNAVSKALAEKSPTKGMVFSLPIDDMVGIGAAVEHR